MLACHVEKKDPKKGKNEHLRAAVEAIEHIINDTLVDHSSETKAGLSPICENKIPFIIRAIVHFKDAPHFFPSYPPVNKKALQVDYESLVTLAAIYHKLEKLTSHLKDTLVTTGSRAYFPALVYYNSVKHAAQNNEPEAQFILQDLDMARKSRHHNFMDNNLQGWDKRIPRASPSS